MCISDCSPDVCSSDLLHRGLVAAPFRAFGGWGLLLAVVFAAGTFFFILALSLTAVADVLVIVAAAPLAAAVLSLVFLGEGVPLRTWVAISLDRKSVG